ncbi:MAG: hypothetical protein OEY56_04035, partial [Cyclobacteriaceae bacterium]|nr:hypothetical protein [Cyclobacteriaceae bacterium]
MKNFLRISLLLLLPLTGLAQPVNIRESVYLHTNNNLLISGETLYFSAHVTSTRDGKPSPLSTLLYVELVNNEKKAVYQSKIELNDGRGYGDIFIPSTFSTGTYQLLAYTRWMKNFDDYFQWPIQIINPFENYVSPVSDGTGSLQVRFFPEGGQLVEGVTSRVVVRMSGGNGTEPLTGKIINNEGDALAGFACPPNGYALFELTPKRGLHYQLLVEDEGGNFLFYELPTIHSRGATIRLDEEGPIFKITVNGAEENEWKGQLFVHDAQTIYLDKGSSTGDVFLLEKQNLPTGLLSILLTDGQGIPVSSRLFQNGNYSEPATSLRSPKTYGHRQTIHESVDLPAGNYSLSIRKTDPLIQDRMPDLATSFYMASHLLDFDVRTFRDLAHTPALMQSGLWLVPLSCKDNLPATKEIRFLPELRGELLEGAITTPDGQPVPANHVTFSVPGEYYRV